MQGGHSSRFTIAYEDTAVSLACHAAVTVRAVLLRITWRSAAAFIARAVAQRSVQTDWLTGLRRIGVGETSYRTGQRYLLYVTDHDTDWLVWVDKGCGSATPRRLFDGMGDHCGATLTHIRVDGAQWIHTVATERAPQAVQSLDIFHVMALTTAALDAVRRGAWSQLLRDEKIGHAKALKSRWALLEIRRISPATNAAPWPRSPRAITRSTAPTCSKTNFTSLSPHRRKTQTAARRLVILGRPVPYPRVRGAAQHDKTVPLFDPQHSLTRRFQRPLRGHQLPPATADPPRLRPGYHSAEALIATAAIT